MTHNLAQVFIATLRYIWKGHNEECFENIPSSPYCIWRLSLTMATTMGNQTDEVISLYIDSLNGVWSKPPPGYMTTDQLSLSCQKVRERLKK